ncbi:sperm-associated antigen 16 protein-like [Eucyclogobius newberryi]|uniref:sperm-associated antigen 16 protein-like n=1 Tax=Eucyclogobius newberryi TaxID=166745 RepID=UPI003B5A7666
MSDDNESQTDLSPDASAETCDGSFSEEERRATPAEENFTAREKTIEEEKSDVGALSTHTSALSITEDNAARDTETVVDFLRTFLSQMEMTDTLDCFQAEWHEMVENGRIVNAKRDDVMPRVYIQNRHLENEVRKGQREIEELTQAITDAEEAAVKSQKARNFHWLRHKRLIQEKNRIIGDIRKLTAQCNDFQPKVKQMNEKYQRLVQQTMQKDKALVQAKQKHNKRPQLDSTSHAAGDE